MVQNLSNPIKLLNSNVMPMMSLSNCAKGTHLLMLEVPYKNVSKFPHFPCFQWSLIVLRQLISCAKGTIQAAFNHPCAHQFRWRHPLIAPTQMCQRHNKKWHWRHLSGTEAAVQPFHPIYYDLFASPTNCLSSTFFSPIVPMVPTKHAKARHNTMVNWLACPQVCQS